MENLTEFLNNQTVFILSKLNQALEAYGLDPMSATFFIEGEQRIYGHSHSDSYVIGKGYTLLGHLPENSKGFLKFAQAIGLKPIPKKEDDEVADFYLAADDLKKIAKKIEIAIERAPSGKTK